MVCKICDKKTNHIFNAKIMGNRIVKYYQCPNCFFMQTEEPFWLNEAYSDAIADADLTILERGYKNTIILNQILKAVGHNNSTILDYGGGYGILTRLMRNLGYNFLWYDKYASNIFAKGFEYTNQKIDLITCFEVFEHFVNPIQEIENLLKISNELIITTNIYDDEGNVPPPSWSYYTFCSGQHISFYSKKTFEYLAQKYNLNYVKINKCWHIFTKNDNYVEKLSFLNDISKDFDKFNREFILNPNKHPVLKDIEYLKKLK